MEIPHSADASFGMTSKLMSDIGQRRRVAQQIAFSALLHPTKCHIILSGAKDLRMPKHNPIILALYCMRCRKLISLVTNGGIPRKSLSLSFKKPHQQFFTFFFQYS